MGTDKAFVQFKGTTLLNLALHLASQVASEVRIVGTLENLSLFAKTVPDIFPARGPLGGIHAALRSTHTDFNLIMAVDTPFIAPEFLRYLRDQSLAGMALVTVPRVNGRLQPLCAIYRRELADPAEALLVSGQNKIDLLFSPEVTRIVTQDEIERLAFPLAMFDNLNTREDLERAQAEAEPR
jgi:molybdopterin-guanine dinucleotide biosynthesis protein A